MSENENGRTVTVQTAANQLHKSDLARADGLPKLIRCCQKLGEGQ